MFTSDDPLSHDPLQENHLSRSANERFLTISIVKKHDQRSGTSSSAHSPCHHVDANLD